MSGAVLQCFCAAIAQRVLRSADNTVVQRASSYRVRSHEIRKEIAGLSIGTLTGRLITVMAMPLLTRLYSPEEFALASVFLSVVTTLAVVVCLRMDVAIPLAESDTDAMHLAMASLLAALIISLVLSIPALGAPAATANLIGAAAMEPYIWLVPPVVLLFALYQTMQHWFARKRQFLRMSQIRFTQAIVAVSVMAGGALMGLAPLSLLVGYACNAGLGGISLAASALGCDWRRLRGITVSQLCDTVRRHARYPLYSTVESLVNVAGLQVPVVIIAKYCGDEAGQLALAMHVSLVPMMVIGSSIAHVYASRASAERAAGRLSGFTARVMCESLKYGAPGLACLGIASPAVFPLLFGDRWSNAGSLVAWLVPWMIVQFVASPVSMVILVAGRQRAMLLLATLGLVIRVGGTAVGLSYAPLGGIYGLAVSSAMYYVLVMLWVVSAAQLRSSHISMVLRAPLTWMTPAAVAFGFGIRFVFQS